MSKSVITIYDIARSLGISPSTVSRALKDDSIISRETRKKVKEKAKDMGYQPNSIASSLRNKKTLTIGVITHRIDRHFQSNAISGIQDKAHEHGYNIIICQTNDDPGREVKQFQALFSSRIDGLIGQLSMYTRNYDHFNLFLKNDIPVVLFDRVPRNMDVRKVVSDDADGGYKATEHLILQGCRKIAHFTGALSLSIYEDRLDGYKTALKKHGIPYDPGMVFEFYLNTANSKKTARSLLSRKTKRPDSIFAANDTSAIAAIQVAKELDIAIPGELAIVGYANDPSGLIISPTLSTIDQSSYRMGQIATASLLKQIEEKEPGNSNSGEITVLPVKLIVRESSARK